MIQKDIVLYTAVSLRDAAVFFAGTKRVSFVYTGVSRREEEGDRHALRVVSRFGFVCIRTGVRDPDHCDLSGGGTPVSCGVSAHRLWLRLSAQIGKEVSMKIVVVKSPRFLKGILRMLFGIRE